MKRIAVVFLVLACARLAYAQAVDHVELQIVPVPTTATSQTWTQTYPMTAVQCNQVPPATVPSPVVSPAKFVYDDPGNAGKVCIGVIGAPLLASLPVGAYAMTLTVTDDLGRTSEKSAPPVPFARAALLSVLTGVRLIR